MSLVLKEKISNLWDWPTMTLQKTIGIKTIYLIFSQLSYIILMLLNGAFSSYQICCAHQRYASGHLAKRNSGKSNQRNCIGLFLCKRKKISTLQCFSVSENVFFIAVIYWIKKVLTSNFYFITIFSWGGIQLLS